MKTKVCNKCNRRKKVSEYYKNSASADGLKNACKACTYQKVKKKKCHVCKETKRTDEFYSGTSRCKACDNKARTIESEKDMIKLAGLLVATETMLSRVKECSVCKKHKDIEEFQTIKANLDGLKDVCKRCERIHDATDLNEDTMRLHQGVADREFIFHSILEKLQQKEKQQ